MTKIHHINGCLECPFSILDQNLENFICGHPDNQDNKTDILFKNEIDLGRVITPNWCKLRDEGVKIELCLRSNEFMGY